MLLPDTSSDQMGSSKTCRLMLTTQLHLGILVDTPRVAAGIRGDFFYEKNGTNNLWK
jgi:hypothetical protein